MTVYSGSPMPLPKAGAPSSYSAQDLAYAYRQLGVRAGETLFVTSDLGRLRNFERPDRATALDAHVRALEEAVGPTGTIVFPAASLNLCNTDIVFHLDTTPSYHVGALSEYVRTLPGSLRSFHPFVSYSARGKRAVFITSSTSRYAFGVASPMARMLDLNATCISIGLHPRWTCTTVHHIEQVMNVPYRYTKEFIHPVEREEGVTREPFYMHVLYRDSDVKRSANKRIFERLEKTDLLRSVDVGRGQIWAYSMQRFADLTIQMMIEDVYIWCESSPMDRPWRR